MQIVLDVSEYQSVTQLDALLGGAADDEIVGVYIKATQDITYRNHVAAAFASVCAKHRTPFGYYDFLTNADAFSQGAYFRDFVRTLPAPQLIPMADCEGAYDKWAAGVLHWENAFGTDCIAYAQLSNIAHYKGKIAKLWLAQYDSVRAYVPTEDEIAAYTAQGFLLWQYTDSYMGLTQDASVVLGPDAFQKLHLRSA